MRIYPLFIMLFLFACIGSPGQSLKKSGDSQYGIASFYGHRFEGKKTASGEVFSVQAFTAAHRSLPFGSIVKVTHLKTGDTAWVRINDRGPFSRNRIIDLSDSAAAKIGLLPLGISRVKVELIHYGPTNQASGHFRHLDEMVMIRRMNCSLLNEIPDQKLFMYHSEYDSSFFPVMHSSFSEAKLHSRSK